MGFAVIKARGAEMVAPPSLKFAWAGVLSICHFQLSVLQIVTLNTLQSDSEPNVCG